MVEKIAKEYAEVKKRLEQAEAAAAAMREALQPIANSHKAIQLSNERHPGLAHGPCTCHVCQCLSSTAGQQFLAERAEDRKNRALGDVGIHSFVGKELSARGQSVEFIGHLGAENQRLREALKRINDLRADEWFLYSEISADALRDTPNEQ